MTKDPDNLEGYIWHDFQGESQRCEMCALPPDDIVHAPEEGREARVLALRAAAAQRKRAALGTT